MRYVCPKDEKKMLLKQARSTYWKKWAAMHEYEELKEGIWLEPALALLRRKTKQEWTEKHRHVARKLVLDGDFSTLVGQMKANAKLVTKGKVQKSTGSTIVQGGMKSGANSEALRKLEQKARTSKKEWMWQRGIVTHHLSESQWNRCHFSVEKWESEKPKSWGLPAEGFKGHVATDGFFLGTAGKWGACGWSVVQLDLDEISVLHVVSVPQ